MSGPLWPVERAGEEAKKLGMIQIDSIRVNGLRNHEIAWAARTDAPVEDLYKVIYRDRAMLETHYPQFATRRDWLPWFIKDFGNTISDTDRLRELRPMMRRLKKRMREEGPISPADLDSERVIGGFNTIKLTTRALDYLFYLGETADRGPHQAFPSPVRPDREGRAGTAGEAQADAHPAPGLLRAFRGLGAEARHARQLTERTAHHIGTWREGWLPVAHKVVDRAIKQGVVVEASFARAANGDPLYALAEELAQPIPIADDVVRIIPPLDNLLFNRRRLTELFGFAYKFEAYTPQAQRRFYFAMPILYGHDVAGPDRRQEGRRRVARGRARPHQEGAGRPPAQAIHRLARIAGATKVEAPGLTPVRLRKAISGKIEGC